MANKNIVDLINSLASVKADASSVYTRAEVDSLTNANKELIEANTDRVTIVSENVEQNKNGIAEIKSDFATKEYSDSNLDSAKLYTNTKLEPYATKEYSDANLDSAKEYANQNFVKTVNGEGIDSNGNVEIKGGAGLEVGDIGIAPLGIDETDNCRRYLNGQVILQSQFEAFTTKLKSAIALYPNLVTSEDNWQSAVTLSPLGQCGKFVIDDEAGTIRLPKVVNVMGALDLSTLGQTVEAGLPNITGVIGDNHTLYRTFARPKDIKGAFYGINGNENYFSATQNSDTSGADQLHFDASLSNSIYGNSETVQQESIKYPYYIQVAISSNVDVQIDTQVRLNNPFSLFMPYWSPIELNNLSWLRSNKQWNNGAVYVSAYEFLLEKYNSGTEQTETISGVSVTYKLADNGMKIITDKSVYDALISASGSAWFFVLDTENTQFILPYTNGFAQFGDELGKFSEAGLPNITGGAYFNEGASNLSSKDGAFSRSTVVGGGRGFGGSGILVDQNIYFDASHSNPIYGKSNTVQPNSVSGYLYFYIGEVEQDANIIATSGLAESVSRKADNDLSNVTAPTQAFKDMVVGWGMPDYSSGINITSSLGQGQTWTAPENGILIHTSLNDNGSCFISHTNANNISNYTLPNWIIYSNTGSGDYQSAMAIVNKNLVVYGATNSNVYGTLMFYPFK